MQLYQTAITNSFANISGSYFKNLQTLDFFQNNSRLVKKISDCWICIEEHYVLREHTISLKVSKFGKVSLDHFVTTKCQGRKIEYINLLTDLVVSFSGGDYFYVLVSFLIDAVKISLFSSSMQKEAGYSWWKGALT